MRALGFFIGMLLSLPMWGTFAAAGEAPPLLMELGATSPLGVAVAPEGWPVSVATGGHIEVQSGFTVFLYGSSGDLYESVVASDSSHVFYAARRSDHVIRKLRLQSLEGYPGPAYRVEVAAEWGREGGGPGEFRGSLRLARASDGRIFALDAGNDRVQVFTGDGVYVTEWPTHDLGDFSPGIAVDGADRVYVVELLQPGYHVYSGQGEHLDWRTPMVDGRTVDAMDVAVDPGGNVYLSDRLNGRVVVHAPTGEVSDWGAPGEGTVQFENGPLGLALDGRGRIYVGDGNRILVFGSLPTSAARTSWGRLKASYR